MIFAGIQKTSLIDYPHKISTVVFTAGCNFNCFYCHNRELINKSRALKSNAISKEEVFNFLQKRKGKIDAVTITGGEPTLHKKLPEFISVVKKLGFLVKLDTNGTNPKMLKELIDKKLLDYVAMDIKAPLKWEKYKKIIRINNKKFFQLVLESVKILIQDQVDYEFRTSLSKGILTKSDIKEIVGEIKNKRVYYLQNFVNFNNKELDEENKILYNKLNPLSIEDLQELKNLVRKMGQKCKIRN